MLGGIQVGISAAWRGLAPIAGLCINSDTNTEQRNVWVLGVCSEIEFTVQTRMASTVLVLNGVANTSLK